MSSQRFNNVWDAIEEDPAQARNLRIRSNFMIALKAYIAKAGLSQSQAASLLGVSQPRISDLVRGKIELFSLDTLVNMADAAGLQIELRVVEEDLVAK